MAYKVAFIGTGARSCAYARPYAKEPEIEIAALADPSANNRRVMQEKSGVDSKPAEYDDWRDMLREHADLDGVVISTPNYLHAEPGVACLERGLAVALEKPLATTQNDCERILDAERANGGRTLIGFVLRSTPFYSRIHQLLTSGAIGRVVSIQADELPSWQVSSIMNRSPWRRYARTSGGAMLEKSCHDMDILNWMTGSRPAALASFGSRMIFLPNPALPEFCDECGVAKDCLYFRRPRMHKGEDVADADLHDFVREDRRCIYNIDKDNIDTQNIAIEYQNGAVANFMLNFNTGGPRSNRNFHAVGLKGRVWGNMNEKKVFWHDNLSDETKEFDTSGDGSGHGGGDQAHARELLRMMREPDYRPEQNAAAGYLSAMMCFASDISRVERRRVDFQYENGKIYLL